MKDNILLIHTHVIFILLFVWGCQKPIPEISEALIDERAKVVAEDPQPKPCWVEQLTCIETSPDTHIHMFLGHSKGSLTQEKALQDAQSDVTNKIVVYMGDQGIADAFSGTSIEGRNNLADPVRIREYGVRMVVDDLIRGDVYTQHQYTQSLILEDPNTTYFRAYVLIEFPERALATLMVLLAREGVIAEPDMVIKALTEKYNLL